MAEPGVETKAAEPRLYLMLGYPGAGKTTTAETIHQLSGAVHLSSDRVRLELFPKPKFTPAEHEALYQEIDNRTEQLLSQGKSVVYDANLNRYIHRLEKYDICARTGAKPVSVWIQVEKAVAKGRATQTGGNDLKRPFGNLDESTFERLVREIEPPRSNEKATRLDGTKITPDYVKQELEL